MKFAVSILAHEKPAIVLDQIENFRRYLPDSAIFLHLHVKFDWEGAPYDFSQLDGVFVNPNPLPTQWGNLHHAHNSNFHFAEKQLNFDHFLLHSSSDLFVRQGATQYIPQFEAYTGALIPLMGQGPKAVPVLIKYEPLVEAIFTGDLTPEEALSQFEGEANAILSAP